MAKRKKKAGRPPKPPENRKIERVYFAIESRRKDRYQRAADALGVDLSEWLRRIADDACRSQGIE